MAQPSWSDFLTGSKAPAQQPTYGQFATGQPPAADVAEAPEPVSETAQPSTLSSIGKAANAVFSAPGALVGRALGVPSYQPQPDPTKATASAAEAVKQAINPGNMDAIDRRMQAGGKSALETAGRITPVDSSVQTTQANADVAAAIQNITGMSSAATQQVLGQPLPAWGKQGAPGEAATNLNTTDGAPRRLNYGYGTEIVGSGKSASGKLNSFSGVGTGAAPAGAAGVFGAGGSAPGGAAAGAGRGDPFSQVQSHLMDIMQQAAAKRAAGDGIGARGLEAHAARFGALFQTIAQHMYQQGLLSQGNKQLGLQGAIAKGPIEINQAVLDQIAGGKPGEAARIKAASAGNAPYQRGTATPMTTSYDPYSENGPLGYNQFPTMPK